MKITVQDLLDVGLQDQKDIDLLTLANNINLLLEDNDIKMVIDEVLSYVNNYKDKYEELLSDYQDLADDYNNLEADYVRLTDVVSD